MIRALSLIPKPGLVLVHPSSNWIRTYRNKFEIAHLAPLEPLPLLLSRFISSSLPRPIMAEEPKTADAGQDTGKNAAAEQDVQNVLAELKGGESAEKTQEQKAEPTNGTEPAKEKDAETKEEERVVAAAATLGEKAAATEEKSRSKPDQGHRGQKRGDGSFRRPFKSGRKSDLTSGEKSSDPNEIRKQVCGKPRAFSNPEWLSNNMSCKLIGFSLSRSSFTSPIQIYPWINSSFPTSVAAKTVP